MVHHGTAANHGFGVRESGFKSWPCCVTWGRILTSLSLKTVHLNRELLRASQEFKCSTLLLSGLIQPWILSVLRKDAPVPSHPPHHPPSCGSGVCLSFSSWGPWLPLGPTGTLGTCLGDPEVRVPVLSLHSLYKLSLPGSFLPQQSCLNNKLFHSHLANPSWDQFSTALRRTCPQSRPPSQRGRAFTGLILCSPNNLAKKLFYSYTAYRYLAKFNCSVPSCSLSSGGSKKK